MSDNALRGQKRAAHIRVKMSVPELEASIEKRAAICRASGVHEAANATKVFQSRVDEPVTVIRYRNICLQK
jgi:hypothetical protein